jgi:hypothetical protein
MKEAIPVTQKHIANGRITRACECPIALALQAVIEYRAASVHVEKLNLGADWEADTVPYANAEPVQDWIERFDSTGYGQPFVLILDHKAKTASVLEEA